MDGAVRMTREVWDDVLMVLAVMIVADTREVDSEVEAFARGVAALQDALEPGDAALPPGAVRAWWHANAARARALVAGEDLNAAVLPWLARLSVLPRKQVLLDTLADVADADSERADAEQDILLLASAFWGLVRVSRERRPVR